MSGMNGKPGCSRGFSMIEVLVALLVIAIGVLGAVALQSRAVQGGMETYQRTQALLLVEDMAARMRNNKLNVSTCYAAVGNGMGYVGVGRDDISSLTGCETQANKDIAAWHQMLLGSAEMSDKSNTATQVGGILSARGCIKSVGNGAYRVSVAWKALNKLGYSTARDSCAISAFTSDGGEPYRRVVSVTVRVTDLR